MIENNINQSIPQINSDCLQQSIPQISDSDPDKIKIEEADEEEYDLRVSDQRRPQFRYSENCGKNYLI